MLAIALLIGALSPAVADEPGIGEPDLTRHVANLRSGDEEARRQAALALIELGPGAKAAVPVLIEILETHDAFERREAIGVLQAIGPDARAAVPVLTELLSHENFHVQYFSCRALGAIGPGARAAVPALIERLESGPASVRHNAATALGQVGARAAPQIIEPLVAALHDRLHPVRLAAALALGQQGPLAKEAAEELKAVVDNPQANFRCPAALALWQVTGEVERPLGALRAELQGDAPEKAAYYIGCIGPAAKDAVPDLTEAVGADDPLLRLNAAEALGRIGPAAKAALPALRQLSVDQEEDVREAAEQALKQIEGAGEGSSAQQKPEAEG